MRIWQASIYLAACVLFSASFTPTARAQSFFEGLFGGGQKVKAAPKSIQIAQRRRPNIARVPRSPIFQSQPSLSMSARQSRRYRTLCVRMCDGFYWPVSASVPRYQVRRDARVCRSRCSRQARLFYLPVGSQNIGAMVDLRGVRYDKMKVAFKYRKKLVRGCQCRPDPWAASELARHARYARAETERTMRLARADAAGETREEKSVLDLQDASQYSNETFEVAALEKWTAGAHFFKMPEQPPRSFSKKARKQSKQKTAKRKASQRVTQRARQRQKPKKPNNSWLFSGQQKYRWPGD